MVRTKAEWPYTLGLCTTFRLAGATTFLLAVRYSQKLHVLPGNRSLYDKLYLLMKELKITEEPENVFRNIADKLFNEYAIVAYPSQFLADNCDDVEPSKKKWKHSLKIWNPSTFPWYSRRRNRLRWYPWKDYMEIKINYWRFVMGKQNITIKSSIWK